MSGIAAGTVALVVGQIGGKLVGGAIPPLQALGDFVVRTTPVSITEALIRAVGHKDKQVLLLCMLVVAGAAASMIGVLFGRGHQRLALSGIGVLALLPALAASGAVAATFTGEAVTLLPGAVLGGLVLRILGTPLRPVLTAPASARAKAPGSGARPAEAKTSGRAKAPMPSGPSSAVSRRQLLRAGLVVTAAAAFGTAAVRRLSEPSVQLMSRLKAALPTPRNLKPMPVDEFARFGAAPLMTPTSSFYRIDTALSLPLVDPDTWALTLTRDGNRVMSWTYDELLALSLDQADITIGCVSNEIGGDLVGTARWQGVLLADLLTGAGVTSAGRVAGVSVDGFVASFPGSYAFDGRPAMVAVGMNGDALPVRHGFPARLVIPGLYGYVSATKWLTQIDVSDSTDLPGFWADRGWAPQGPVHIMSRIDSPRNGSQTPSGTVRAAGVAWAPIVGVGAVELRVDDGPWQPATLSTAIEGTLWRQWIADVTVPHGTAHLTVRATDGKGVRQDTTGRPVFPSGSTGLHTVRVTSG